jgi:hypothetical protein
LIKFWREEGKVGKEQEQRDVSFDLSLHLDSFPDLLSLLLLMRRMNDDMDF